MRSKRIATIIPSMTTEVAIETTKIHSVCRLLYDLRCSADLGATIRVLVNWVLRTTACSFLTSLPNLTLNPRGIAAATPGPKGNGQPHGRRGDLSCQCNASRRKEPVRIGIHMGVK